MNGTEAEVLHTWKDESDFFDFLFFGISFGFPIMYDMIELHSPHLTYIYL